MKKLSSHILFLVFCTSLQVMGSESIQLLEKKELDDPQTILEAATQGEIDTVKYLLEKGADTSVTNSDGNTAMHLAAMNNYTEIVKLLLSCVGKGFFEKKWPKNNDDETCFDVARRAGHTKVIELLLQEKTLSETMVISCLKNAIIDGQKEMVSIILKESKFNSDVYKKFVLLAMDKNQPDILGLFINAFLKVEDWIYSSEGSTERCKILHYAAYKGLAEIVELLLVKGVSPFLRTLISENGKWRTKHYTALHIAAKEGHGAVCEALLKGVMLRHMKNGLIEWIVTLEKQGITVERNKKEVSAFLNTYFYKRLLKYLCITDDISKSASACAKGSIRLTPESEPIYLWLILAEDYFHIYFPYLLEIWFEADLNLLAADYVVFRDGAKRLMKEFAKTGPKCVVADSKLYTKETAATLRHINFITRVPSTIKAEGKLVAEALELDGWHPILEGDYKVQEFESGLYDIPDQRLIVAYSNHARKRSEKTLKRQVNKEKEKVDKALFHLQAQRFMCKSDALKALKVIEKKLSYHRISSIEIAEIKKYANRGRPKKDAPQKIEIQIKAQASQDEKTIDIELQEMSCFVLATNVAQEDLSSEQVLRQ